MSWFPKKCVVVPIDFSSASDEAIQTAIELARRPEEVHVVHVALVPDIIPYAGEVIAPVAPERGEIAPTAGGVRAAQVRDPACVLPVAGALSRSSANRRTRR